MSFKPFFFSKRKKNNEMFVCVHFLYLVKFGILLDFENIYKIGSYEFLESKYEQHLDYLYSDTQYTEISFWSNHVSCIILMKNKTILLMCPLYLSTYIYNKHIYCINFMLKYNA